MFFAGFDVPSTGSGRNIGTSAQGINDAQQIVGFYQDSLSHLHGFLLSGTSYDDAKGVIYNVGNYFDSAGREHGFFNHFYSGTFITLDGPPGSVSVHPKGVDSAGRIVGTYTNTAGNELPFIYIGGEY